MLGHADPEHAYTPGLCSGHTLLAVSDTIFFVRLARMSTAAEWGRPCAVWWAKARAGPARAAWARKRLM